MNPRFSSSSDVPALVVNVPALVADSQSELPSPIDTMQDMLALMEEHKIFVISDSVLTYSHDSSPLVFLYWGESRELPALLAPFFSRPVPVHPFNHVSPHRQYILNYEALAVHTSMVYNDDDYAYYHINAALSLTVSAMASPVQFTLPPQTPGLPLATLWDFPQFRSYRRDPVDMQIERTFLAAQFGLTGARLTQDQAADFVTSAKKYNTIPLSLRFIDVIPNSRYAELSIFFDRLCSLFRVQDPADDPAWDLNDPRARLFPQSEDALHDDFIKKFLKRPEDPLAFYRHLELQMLEGVPALNLNPCELRRSFLAEVHIRDLPHQRRELNAMEAMDQLAQTHRTELAIAAEAAEQLAREEEMAVKELAARELAKMKLADYRVQWVRKVEVEKENRKDLENIVRERNQVQVDKVKPKLAQKDTAAALTVKAGPTKAAMRVAAFRATAAKAAEQKLAQMEARAAELRAAKAKAAGARAAKAKADEAKAPKAREAQAAVAKAAEAKAMAARAAKAASEKEAKVRATAGRAGAPKPWR